MQAASDQTQRKMTLLRECRTRLTAGVATGGPDVCETTADLPDEADGRDGLPEEIKA